MVVVGEAQDVTAVCHAVEDEVVVLGTAREEDGDVVEIGVAGLGFAGLLDGVGMDGGEVVAAEECDMGTCSGDSGGGDKVDVDEFDFEPS